MSFAARNLLLSLGGAVTLIFQHIEYHIAWTAQPWGFVLGFFILAVVGGIVSAIVWLYRSATGGSLA